MQKDSLFFREVLWIALFIVVLISSSCTCSRSYTRANEKNDGETDTGPNTTFNGDSSNDKDTGQDRSTLTSTDTVSPSRDAEQPSPDTGGSSQDAETPSDRSEEASVDATETGLVFPELADAGDAAFLNPRPKPTGGLEAGHRAPAPGEVPPNDYGGPVAAGMSPSGTPFGYLFGEPCKGGGTYSVGETDDNPCVRYFRCTINCIQDSDCSDGGSGNALAECVIGDPDSSWSSGKCFLFCDEDAVCPNGMTCVFSRPGERGKCLWPYDVLSPGCPAWCELDPLPQDCLGSCAALGVGCDPEIEDYCCEGLVCDPRGWCVEQESW